MQMIALHNPLFQALKIFPVYFVGPFGVLNEHTGTFLSNSFDANGLMLMILIIHQNQVSSSNLYNEALILCFYHDHCIFSY